MMILKISSEILWKKILSNLIFKYLLFIEILVIKKMRSQFNLFIDYDLIKKVKEQSFLDTSSKYMEKHLRSFFKLKDYVGRELLDIVIYKLLFDLENMEEEEREEYKESLKDLKQELEIQGEI